MIFGRKKKSGGKPFIRSGGALFDIKCFRMMRRGIGFIVAQCLKVYWGTFRIEFEGGAEGLIGDTSRPVTILIWHNNLMFAPFWWKARRGRRMSVIISAGAIGAWISDLFSHFNLNIIRGSENLRGKQALKEMVLAIKGGEDVVITPDGSRGPVYRMKPGAALLVKNTGCGVLMITHEFRCALRCWSWDGFFIPIPFSKVVVRAKYFGDYGELGCEEGNVEEIRGRMEEEMLGITKE